VKHKGHNITIPDEIKNSKTEELKRIIKTLQDKKAVHENIIVNASQIHHRFSKSIDQVRIVFAMKFLEL